MLEPVHYYMVRWCEALSSISEALGASFWQKQVFTRCHEFVTSFAYLEVFSCIRAGETLRHFNMPLEPLESKSTSGNEVRKAL